VRKPYSGWAHGVRGRHQQVSLVESCVAARPACSARTRYSIRSQRLPSYRFRGGPTA
jgi:hypothetical protein